MQLVGITTHLTEVEIKPITEAAAKIAGKACLVHSEEENQQQNASFPYR
ncbi:hypothetical protein ALTER154_70078 [Alteromonas sp. 154]|nr:hypothetical protein ALTER154_70078 [Alteromonas sp. 154]